MIKARSSALLLSLTLALAATQASAANGLAPPNNHLAPVPAQKPAADGTLGMALVAAFVQSNATLITGAGVTSVAREGSCATGCYTVTFNRDVSACFYSVSTYYRNYFTAVESAGGNSVNVFIADSTPALADVPFYLTVYCVR